MSTSGPVQTDSLDALTSFMGGYDNHVVYSDEASFCIAACPSASAEDGEQPEPLKRMDAPLRVSQSPLRHNGVVDSGNKKHTNISMLAEEDEDKSCAATPLPARRRLVFGDEEEAVGRKPAATKQSNNNNNNKNNRNNMIRPPKRTEKHVTIAAARSGSKGVPKNNINEATKQQRTAMPRVGTEPLRRPPAIPLYGQTRGKKPAATATTAPNAPRRAVANNALEPRRGSAPTRSSTYGRSATPSSSLTSRTLVRSRSSVPATAASGSYPHYYYRSASAQPPASARPPLNGRTQQQQQQPVRQPLRRSATATTHTRSIGTANTHNSNNRAGASAATRPVLHRSHSAGVRSASDIKKRSSSSTGRAAPRNTGNREAFQRSASAALPRGARVGSANNANNRVSIYRRLNTTATIHAHTPPSAGYPSSTPKTLHRSGSSSRPQLLRTNSGFRPANPQSSFRPQPSLGAYPASRANANDNRANRFSRSHTEQLPQRRMQRSLSAPKHVDSSGGALASRGRRTDDANNRRLVRSRTAQVRSSSRGVHNNGARPPTAQSMGRTAAVRQPRPVIAIHNHNNNRKSTGRGATQRTPKEAHVMAPILESSPSPVAADCVSVTVSRSRLSGAAATPSPLAIEVLQEESQRYSSTHLEDAEREDPADGHIRHELGKLTPTQYQQLEELLWVLARSEAKKHQQEAVVPSTSPKPLPSSESGRGSSLRVRREVAAHIAVEAMAGDSGGAAGSDDEVIIINLQKDVVVAPASRGVQPQQQLENGPIFSSNNNMVDSNANSPAGFIRCLSLETTLSNTQLRRSPSPVPPINLANAPMNGATNAYNYTTDEEESSSTDDGQSAYKRHKMHFPSPLQRLQHVRESAAIVAKNRAVQRQSLATNNGVGTSPSSRLADNAAATALAAAATPDTVPNGRINRNGAAAGGGVGNAPAERLEAEIRLPAEQLRLLITKVRQHVA